MAKRFIDTSFYKSPFVRGLKGPLKGLYTYIICECDGAGIWAADFEIATMYLGFQVSKKEFDDAFLSSGKAVDLKNGRYFFPDFIEHQYPKGLSNHNPAQKNFIIELQKYSLLDDDLKPLKRPYEAPSKPLPRDIGIGNGIGIGKGNGIGNGKRGVQKEIEVPPVEEFMDYYRSELSAKFPNLEFSVQAKYEAWLSQGWKDGYGKEIKQWKTKLKSTIVHLKPTPTPKQGDPNTFENRMNKINDEMNNTDWTKLANQ